MPLKVFNTFFDLNGSGETLECRVENAFNVDRICTELNGQNGKSAVIFEGEAVKLVSKIDNFDPAAGAANRGILLV